MFVLSRRGLLIGLAACAATGAATGGAAYGMVEHSVLPGKYELNRLLGACGSDPGVPRVAAGPVVARTFYSRYRRRTVNMFIMRPPGRLGALPVTLVLHGAGADAAAAVALGYPQYLAAAIAAGISPFAAVAVDGGSATYWHPRSDSDDPQGMLIYEVLPRLRQQGYHVAKIGLAGWSMGGYGALLLAARLGPPSNTPSTGTGTGTGVAAVAVSSPAIFASYADASTANPGSFDSPADFAANDIQSAANVAVLRQIPTRIDCGSNDPFAPQDLLLQRALGDPANRVTNGCHDNAFFRRNLPAQLAFLGQHLA